MTRVGRSHGSLCAFLFVALEVAWVPAVPFAFFFFFFFLIEKTVKEVDKAIGCSLERARERAW